MDAYKYIKNSNKTMQIYKTIFHSITKSRSKYKKKDIIKSQNNKYCSKYCNPFSPKHIKIFTTKLPNTYKLSKTCLKIY